jgi:hypothetical protein
MIFRVLNLSPKLPRDASQIFWGYGCNLVKIRLASREGDFEWDHWCYDFCGVCINN